MDNVVGQIWFTPQSWAQLSAAIIAAGLPKREHLSSYEKFVAEFVRTSCELEEPGVMSKRVPVSVDRMLEWCRDHGLSIDAASRAKYVRSAHGDNPMGRIRDMRKRAEASGINYREHQRSGMLCCWDDGTDARWGR
jgi:hypothetical protein